MSGTKAGGVKARNTVYERYGEDFYHNIGRKGGQNGHTGGFFANPALARRAGRKGGRISTRAGIKTGEGRYSRLRKLHLAAEEANEGV